jgi:hypothetical protein
MDFMRLATVGFIALAVISACSPAPGPTGASSPAEPDAVLDGTYRVEIDGARTLRDGGPSPDASASLQWAFRSSCRSACIAVAVPVNDEDPPKVGTPAVWDYVKGAWVKTAAGQLACGGALTPTLETWSLRPGDHDTLTGMRHLAFFGTGCGSVLEQFVTVSRVGDVRAAVSIPDPATQAALKPSAGAGLRGRYNKVQTPQGQPALPVITLTVRTNCIRNTEHCLTYTVYEPPDKPRRVSAYQLLDGRWFSAVPYDVTCPDGQAVRITVETEWRLPERPADPIPRLVGVQHDNYAEPCARTVESQLLLERIGD